MNENAMPLLARAALIALLGVWVWLMIRIMVNEWKRNKGPSVGPIRFVTVVSERRGTNMKYDIMELEVGLPASETPDTIGHELTIERAETADGELLATETMADVGRAATFEAVQDTEVKLSVVAIDNATPPSKSEPKTLTFSVPDTIAPAAPSGEFTIKATAERQVGIDPASSEGDSAGTSDPAPPEDPAEADPAETETTPGE